MPAWKIPLFQLTITEEDVEAVSRPLRQQWLTMGEETQLFENEFQEKIHSKYCLAVSNGTAALHMALMALGIGAGDEVLVPSLTFVACANVIRAVDAIPVFVDLSSETDWTISPEDAQNKITPRTRAVMMVHYAGFPCRMQPLLDLARQHNLWVIEDCAHALVTKHEDAYCGCFGDIGCFSLFSNKNMTTGEGGFVTTQRDDLGERLRLIRSHGMTTLTLDRFKGRALSYDVVQVGLNYRIDELRSALGRSQLRRLDANLQRRAEIYRRYVEQLRSIPGVLLPFIDRNPDDLVGYHIFPMALPEAIPRNDFMTGLQQDGIQTSIHYPPIHQFQAYQEYLKGQDCHCPLTESIAKREVTLPFYPEMKEEDVDYVCRSIRRYLDPSAS